MKRICLVAALFANLSFAGMAAATEAENACTGQDNRDLVDVAVARTENKILSSGNSVMEGVLGYRRCLSSRPLEWKVVGAFDHVDTKGKTTTAGRIVGGLLFWYPAIASDDNKVVRRLAVGANVALGYEDYPQFALTPSGAITRSVRQRSANSVGVTATYIIQSQSLDTRWPPKLGSLIFEGGATYFDKRAISSGAPAYVNEDFGVLSAAAAITQHINHEPFGSKLEYRYTYQHFVGDALLIHDIHAARLQWRPQVNPRLNDSPDRFAVDLTRSWGDQNYSAWTLGLSKAF